ncbi:NlpC/P60 family protein [Alteribacillus sp. JSM 102045]|uniref:C40 family peptidase n=1 Tax=Alteribacillus sp. JSM 102045 TaxID=1562101 RepID=UPI0035C145C3
MNKLWQKLIFSLAAAILLNLPMLSAAAPAEKDSEETKEAYVDVSVMTVWVSPDDTRDIDEPALSNPVKPWEWTESMTVDDKLDLVGSLETQALYGMKVDVLEEEGDWVKVAVEGQPTPRHDSGYPGWVPKEQIVESRWFEHMQSKDFATITSPTAHLYHDRALQKEHIEVSFNTRLPVIVEQSKRVLLATPSDGYKWADKEDLDIYGSVDDIPDPSPQDLVETGEMFNDLPYLWAGVTGFGFDCSGFTHTIYKAHGITIPRDSSVQAEHGEHVERDNLEVGDLLFFAYNGGEGAVHHVGMYIGDGEMIHSPNSRSTVEMVKVDESDYADSYHSARRYLTE